MKFSHTEDQRENQHLDILTDEENGLRIIVSRLGAELVSLARINEAGEWTGFLYRDNDVSASSPGWANHATQWAGHFFMWNRAWAWPIITSNAFLKRRKEFKQFLRAANCAPPSP